MPEQTDRITELRENAERGEYPYHSKSRILKYVKCPRQFEYSYLKDLKEPETYAMRRGTTIHETFEEYYHNVRDYISTCGKCPNPDELAHLLPDYRRWQPYLEPYISNFLCFEARRLAEASSAEAWLPVEIEGEGWLEDPFDQGDDAIPAMGYVDVIYHADSIPGMLDSGKVIVDFKTGKTQDEDYREDGIYLQGEFYAMLFEQEYKITGVAGYYPRNDDFVLASPDSSRRSNLVRTMMEIEELSREQQEQLETDEQPLCRWGEGDDEKCAYYDICPSTFGEPLKHADEFRSLVDRGWNNGKIAAHFGCDYGAVSYAKYKLGLS